MLSVLRIMGLHLLLVAVAAAVAAWPRPAHGGGDHAGAQPAARPAPGAARPGPHEAEREGAPPPASPIHAEGAGSRTPTLHPWFRWLPDAAANWTLSRDAADPRRYRIVARNARAGGGPIRKVLILYAIPSPLLDEPLSVVLETFRREGIPADFTLIYFKSDPALGRRALDLARAGHFDLILSMGSKTTAFVSAAYSHGAVPVVTIMSKDPVLLGQISGYDAGSGTDIAYTSVNVPVQVQMAYLRELKPGLRSIGVLYSADDTSAIQTQVLPLRRMAAAQHVQVLDVRVTNAARARRDLATVMPRVLAQMAALDPARANCIFWITGSTAVTNEIATVNRLAARVPVLSVFPELVTGGEDSAVLAVGASFHSDAQLAAIYGIKILRGEARPGDLKVGTVSPPDIAINFHKAREIGLKIPFSFFESASYIYGPDGALVRDAGQTVHGARGNR